MLAFSTCWNNSRHSDGEDIITEIRELGFEWMELSHGMTIAKLPGLLRAYENKLFKCCGVHNFFPSPTEVVIDAPDAYEYTSFREFERTRAYNLTLKSFENAARFDAKYMVLHMGSNHKMPTKNWSKPLERHLKDGTQDSKEFAKLYKKFITRRQKTAGIYMKRAMYYLELLEDKAREFGIKLAVESRSHYEQVPTESEMVELQEHFSQSDNVGYWHDFGHVHRKHNLGLLDHKDWLASMEPYLIGAHLHDVQWPTRDHRVPFQGEIPYQELIPYFTNDLALVWELSPTRKAADIKESLARWKQEFPETL